VKLLADLHISPRTVSFLRSLGHDALRVDEVMLANSSDSEIIARAIPGRPVHAGGQEYKVQYLLAESNTGMFGGNSNWRGPVVDARSIH
jgi:hypothetical protein